MTNGKVLATVSGEAIYESDVMEMIGSMGQRGAAYDNPQGKAAILEQLINKKLMLLDAKRNLFEREEAFKAQLARVKEELLANYCVEKIIADVKVTDAEAEDFFKNNEAEFVTGESVEASHILVDSKEKCVEIMAEINEGKLGFDDAARKYSSCPSKEAGGALGQFTRGQMVPEFDTAVFEMAEGEVRGPVKTQFGYHIIKLTAKHEPEKMEFSAVAGHIKERLLQEKQQKAYQSKINQLKIMYMVDKF